MEYARNALQVWRRWMKIRSVFVYTHDTIGLMGEDGPTHQPVEQLASLRLMPNMETRRGHAIRWKRPWPGQQAIERKDGPTSLVLTPPTSGASAARHRAAQLAGEIARGG